MEVEREKEKESTVCPASRGSEEVSLGIRGRQGWVGEMGEVGGGRRVPLTRDEIGRAHV